MSTFTGALKDIRALGGAMERTRRDQQRSAQEDVLIDATRRLMLQSPDGNWWALTVDNAGALNTTNMGATPYG